MPTCDFKKVALQLWTYGRLLLPQLTEEYINASCFKNIQLVYCYETSTNGIEELTVIQIDSD